MQFELEVKGFCYFVGDLEVSGGDAEENSEFQIVMSFLIGITTQARRNSAPLSSLNLNLAHLLSFKYKACASF